MCMFSFLLILWLQCFPSSSTTFRHLSVTCLMNDSSWAVRFESFLLSCSSPCWGVFLSAFSILPRLTASIHNSSAAHANSPALLTSTNISSTKNAPIISVMAPQFSFSISCLATHSLSLLTQFSMLNPQPLGHFFTPTHPRHYVFFIGSSVPPGSVLKPRKAFLSMPGRLWCEVTRVFIIYFISTYFSLLQKHSHFDLFSVGVFFHRQLKFLGF